MNSPVSIEVKYIELEIMAQFFDKQEKGKDPRMIFGPLAMSIN